MANRSRTAGERRTLWRDDRAHLWHPFTQATEYEATPPFIVRSAQGMWLTGVDGSRCLDAVSSLWCNVLGHRHPAIDRAIRKQLARVAHSTLLGVSHEPAIRLARRLVELAPRGLTRVFFSDDGSTAVEVALKMAFQFRQQSGERGDARRKRFVVFSDAYHGDTIGSVSLGSIPLFHRTYGPLLFDHVAVPSPYAFWKRGSGTLETAGAESLRALGAALRKRGGEVTAVVLEPLVQGASGMHIQPKGFVRAVASEARRHGAFLILDEVATGFGRTGTMFACEQERVAPDFLCLAKGITGGYLPLAATLTTERVFRAFRGRPDEHRTFFHGHTYTGNPLACAAALATLEVLARPGFLAGVRRRAEHLGRTLERFRLLPWVGEIRRCGFMAAVDLWQDPVRRIAFPEASRIGYWTCVGARDHGVLARPLGDTLTVNPPLTMGPRDLDRVVDGLIRAATKTVAERGTR